MEQDRERANKLYLALRNGVGSFPGALSLTGITMERDQAEKLLVPNLPGAQARAHYDAITQRLAKGKVDFAFVIQSRNADPRDDPYGASKAALLAAGVASQFVSYELIDSDQQFRYAMTNVALSFFVKLGGVPWSVVPARGSASLVVGIGRAETRTGAGKSRLTGFAISVLSDGQYIATDYFPPAKSYEEFLEVLGPALTNALVELLRDRPLERLTIHVTQFERFDLVKVVGESVQIAQDKSGVYVPFEIVRVTVDSDFMVMDLGHNGYVSAEGTVVSLRPTRALLVTEGRDEKSVWRGRKPVSLELNRENYGGSTIDFRQTVADAFALSAVNLRGVNAVTQPISVQYAQLLAEQVAKVADFDPDLAGTAIQNELLRDVPWFI
ncbi:MAG: Piwi domain-containing protein [Thermoanaerobaculia bacterium]